MTTIIAEDREHGKCHLYQSALNDHHIALRFFLNVPWLSIKHMFLEFDGIFRKAGPKFIEEKKSRIGSKVQFALHCRFKKGVMNVKLKEMEFKYDVKWVSLPSCAVENVDDILSDEVRADLQGMIYRFMTKGSNWCLESILAAEWTLVKYNRLVFYQGMGAQ